MKWIRMRLLGWVGSSLLVSCSLPQIYKTFKTHSADDLSWAFFGMWFIGDILAFIYILDLNIRARSFQYPLLCNYAVSAILCGLLLVAKSIF